MIGHQRNVNATTTTAIIVFAEWSVTTAIVLETFIIVFFCVRFYVFLLIFVA